MPLAACFRGAISKCPEILNYWNWIVKGMKEHFLFMLSFWQVAVSYFVFNLIVLFTICFYFYFYFSTVSCFNFISYCFFFFCSNLLLVCSSLFYLHVFFSDIGILDSQTQCTSSSFLSAAMR